ncbi:hypothetical protein AKJ16_DCAP18088, partial [Drosera capensis]
MLGIQSKSFGFSGTKDKRAVTVFKMHTSRLASLNNSYVNDGLLLGQFLGNQITITLRGVVADSLDIIKESADALGKQGFLNYFGLQRFGSGTAPTHIIGAALLRGEDDAAKIREYYKETYDIDRTLQQLPYNLVAERAICLKKCPGNHLQALIGVPRTLRMISRAIYPANDIADIFHDLAGKDKSSLTENAHMSNENRPLAETDLDIILKSKASNGARLQQDTANGTKLNHSDSGILSDVSSSEARKTEADSAAGESDYQTQTALKLQFTLPASSYVTIAIRELLKTSTL